MSERPGWADDLAGTILEDARVLGYADARTLIAHRLESVRLQGLIDATDAAGQKVDRMLGNLVRLI